MSVTVETATLTPAPLSAEAFAPFGDAFRAPAGPDRLYHSEVLANLRGDRARADFSLARVPLSALPLQATVMERHRFSSQTFVPMAPARFLVLVAPHAASGGPDMANARAFIAAPGQGVTYRADTWHHGLTLLEGDTAFAVFMWNDGTDDDTEFLTLAEPVMVGAPKA